MLTTRKEKSNNKRRVTPMMVVIALVLTLSLVVGIGARYIYIRSTTRLTQVSALDFYFTVDVLGDTNELTELEKDIYLFGGNTQTATFSVLNYFDELRTNSKAIDYTVKVEDDNANYDSYTLTSGAESTPLAPSYTFTEGGTKQSNDFTLTMNAGYTKTTKVTVTVKSSSPYVKEMKLNFILSRNDAPMKYRVDDKAGNNYATLIIMANEAIAADKIQVSWSDVNATENKLQLDTTSPHVLDGTVIPAANKPASNGYISTITTTRAIKANESIQIYLFKADPNEDYSVPDTNVAPDDTTKQYFVTIS